MQAMAGTVVGDACLRAANNERGPAMALLPYFARMSACVSVLFRYSPVEYACSPLFLVVQQVTGVTFSKR